MPEFRVTTMSAADAERICAWTYPPPYGMYDLEAGDAAMLLDAALNYRAVRDGDALAGFACYGEDAQVVGGRYEEAALDIGCGMDPVWVGQGRGAAFIAAIVAYACATWQPVALRLSVATFNRRAVAVYRRAGFRTTDWFAGTTRHGTAAFQMMMLRVPRPRPRAPAIKGERGNPPPAATPPRR